MKLVFTMALALAACAGQVAFGQHKFERLYSGSIVPLGKGGIFRLENGGRYSPYMRLWGIYVTDDDALDGYAGIYDCVPPKPQAARSAPCPMHG